jgi:hypothetical protein
MKPDMDPSLLCGYFVVEIGVRQAWPYIAFASNDNGANPAEMRLYIDSGFTVTPMPIGLGMGEEDEVRLGLLRLAEVVNLTVHEVTVEKDASLSLSFYGDVFLHVSGQPASWTTHDVWWLAAGCR